MRAACAVLLSVDAESVLLVGAGKGGVASAGAFHGGAAVGGAGRATGGPGLRRQGGHAPDQPAPLPHGATGDLATARRAERPVAGGRGRGGAAQPARGLAGHGALGRAGRRLGAELHVGAPGGAGIPDPERAATHLQVQQGGRAGCWGGRGYMRHLVRPMLPLLFSPPPSLDRRAYLNAE